VLIVGVNAYHGDVSAVLLRDGRLVTAVEEERFRRVKHWAGFPRESLRVCMETAGVEAHEIDHLAVSRNPRANLLRKVAFVLRKRPTLGLVRGRAANLRRVNALPETLAEALGLAPSRVTSQLHWIEHHPAHLASAFFASPFEEAAVCAVDGFGDFVSTSMALGRGSSLEVLKRVYFPHSLGLLYLAVTQYLGFLAYGDEFKVMGLAPYGRPDHVRSLRQVLVLESEGRFRLDLAFFRHASSGDSMTWDDGEPKIGPVYTSKLEELLGGPARKPEEPLTPRHEAIAASLQVVYEEAMFHVLNALYRRTRMPRLCLAGGCAMNSVANGKIRERTPFTEVYIQPAAGDNGTALGAALYVQHQVLGMSREFVMDHGYWGPEFEEADVRATLESNSEDLESRGCRVRRIDNEDELCRWTAARIAEGRVVGWFQGRMEWGARALGNRSIVADPRRPDMREIINAKIKFREKFRPFAPSILEEFVHDYFVDAVADPFMIQVYPVREDKRDVIPAVTHVDGSGRLQTVSRRTNPRYWRLIDAFRALTDVPVLLNTSFNENEPIVHKPEQALDCFLRTSMDVLVMGDHVVEKSMAGQSNREAAVYSQLRPPASRVGIGA
jgi:carbamoyltransferase